MAGPLVLQVVAIGVLGAYAACNFENLGEILCGVDVEERLYRSAADMGITCITISQRLALTEFHAQELHLGAPNAQGWTLTKIDPVDAPSDPEDARDDLSEDSESGVLIGG